MIQSYLFDRVRKQIIFCIGASLFSRVNASYPPNIDDPLWLNLPQRKLVSPFMFLLFSWIKKPTSPKK